MSVIQNEPTLGQLIDMTYALDLEIREANKNIKELAQARDRLKAQIITHCAEEDIESARGATATVTINKETVAHVENWEEVYAYIKANDAFYLLKRQILSAPYRDLRIHTEGEIPGISPYEKTSLSMRKR